MLEVVVGVMALSMIAWLSVSTANFLIIVDYSYDGATQQFELKRNVKWPRDVEAIWRTEAYGNGLQCSEMGENIYEKYTTDRFGVPVIRNGIPGEIGVVRWPAGAQLLPCLSDPDVSLVTQWAMHVWGPIYLRPTMRYIPDRDGKDDPSRGPRGAKGDKGDTGDTGPTGPTGPQRKPG
jgi:hypothetical protein